MAYILGHWSFRGLDFLVDHRVIVPDASVELMVDLAVEQPSGARIHDVGTGCGVIALAIAAERPDLIVTASDISPAAIAVAKCNADRLAVSVPLIVAPGLPPGTYDLVVANLPYGDMEGRTPTLTAEQEMHEPHIAVFGGRDGLDVIRSFAQGARGRARLVAVQHAPWQTDAVRALFQDCDTRKSDEDTRSFTIGELQTELAI